MTPEQAAKLIYVLQSIHLSLAILSSCILGLLFWLVVVKR